MITFALYLLKVIVCSGLLCGYYFVALRNRAFHKWNRFYLLAAVILALLVPLLKINIRYTESDKGAVIQMLQTMSYGNEAVAENSSNQFPVYAANSIKVTYLFISTILISLLFTGLYKIKKLRKKYPATKVEGVCFISTDAKGTPFSFFNSIFWNNAIDLQSKAGQQIFNHEIAHVKEKHSYDKIFMNVVLIFFWINPFFLLIRKELNMIHEFTADQQALEDSDPRSFAEMILQSAYAGHNFSISNNFFYSPLKRRLLMLKKNHNQNVSYLGRLLVLPVAAIVFFAFIVKVKSGRSQQQYAGKIINDITDGDGGYKEDGGNSVPGIIEEKDTSNISKNENYMQQKDSAPVPKVPNFNRIEGKAVLVDSINKFSAKADTIIIKSINKENNLDINLHTEGSRIKITANASDTSNPVYYIDEKEISKDELKNIPVDNIQSINVLKGKSAFEKYGDKGKDGVVEIYLYSKQANR